MISMQAKVWLLAIVSALRTLLWGPQTVVPEAK